MKLVLASLARAVVTQLHPRMLWLAVWPFLLGIVFWGALGFLFREQALGALHEALFGMALTRWIEDAFRWFSLEALLVLVVPLIYGLLLFTLAIVTALVIIGVFAMPAVVDHIANRDYPALERKQGGSRLVGFTNALWATLLFVAGWLVTMPLWLFVPFAFLVPWFWWAWLTLRILRYDCLAEHASAEERHTLYDESRAGLYAIALAVAALNFVPPLFFVVPILSGIAFTHYGLACLKRLRERRALAALAPAQPGVLVAGPGTAVVPPQFRVTP